MAAGPDDAAIWAIVKAWALPVVLFVGGVAMTVIAALFGRVVKKHDQEIKNISDGISGVKREIGAIGHTYTPLVRFELHETRTRESIIELHKKIENSEQRLAAKIDGGHAQIMDALLNMKGRK